MAITFCAAIKLKKLNTCHLLHFFITHAECFVHLARVHVFGKQLYESHAGFVGAFGGGLQSAQICEKLFRILRLKNTLNFRVLHILRLYECARRRPRE